MRALTKSDSELIRDVDQILSEELLNPFTLTIKPQFDDLDGMADFVIAADFSMGITRTVEETRIALRKAGQKLAMAHSAAAAIDVPRLRPGQIKEFSQHLEALNQDIKKDSDFKQALELSKTLVATLKKLPASSFS